MGGSCRPWSTARREPGGWRRSSGGTHSPDCLPRALCSTSWNRSWPSRGGRGSESASPCSTWIISAASTSSSATSGAISFWRTWHAWSASGCAPAAGSRGWGERSSACCCVPAAHRMRRPWPRKSGARWSRPRRRSARRQCPSTSPPGSPPTPITPSECGSCYSLRSARSDTRRRREGIGWWLGVRALSLSQHNRPGFPRRRRHLLEPRHQIADPVRRQHAFLPHASLGHREEPPALSVLEAQLTERAGERHVLGQLRAPSVRKHEVEPDFPVAAERRGTLRHVDGEAPGSVGLELGHEGLHVTQLAKERQREYRDGSGELRRAAAPRDEGDLERPTLLGFVAEAETVPFRFGVDPAGHPAEVLNPRGGVRR